MVLLLHAFSLLRTLHALAAATTFFVILLCGVGTLGGGHALGGLVDLSLCDRNRVNFVHLVPFVHPIGDRLGGKSALENLQLRARERAGLGELHLELDEEAALGERRAMHWHAFVGDALLVARADGLSGALRMVG